MNLALAVTKHLRVTGKDSNRSDIWTEERDVYDVYLQQNRQLVTRIDKVWKEGIFYACFWRDGVGVLTANHLNSLITLLDDLAEMQGPQVEQGRTSMGQHVWEPRYTAKQGKLVCQQCGLCKQLLIPDRVD